MASRAFELLVPLHKSANLYPTSVTSHLVLNAVVSWLALVLPCDRDTLEHPLLNEFPLQPITPVGFWEMLLWFRVYCLDIQRL